jgi:general secretion pathway protein K
MNLNLLRQTSEPGIYTAELIFTRLLIALKIPDSQALQQALSDWLSEEPAESDPIYLERTPAYRVSHMPLSSISELGLIQGFSPERVAALTPYVSALPQESHINVNTAPAEVLAALLDTPLSSALNLVDERMAYPFTSTQEFMDRAQAKAIAIADQGALGEMITVNSQYFLLKTVAVCKKTTLISYSFIKRSPEGQATVYQNTQQL